MTKYNVYSIFDNRLGNIYAPNEQTALLRAKQTFTKNSVGYVEEV